MLIKQFFASNSAYKFNFHTEKGETLVLDINKGTHIEVSKGNNLSASSVNFVLENDSLVVLVGENPNEPEVRLVFKHYQYDEITVVTKSESGLSYYNTLSPEAPSNLVEPTDILLSQQMDGLARGGNNDAGSSNTTLFVVSGILALGGAVVTAVKKLVKPDEPKPVDNTDGNSEPLDTPISIRGDITADTQEDNHSSAVTGKLIINNSSPDSVFSTSVEKTEGDLGGTLTIATDGSWTYHRDDANTKVQALAEGESAVETFVVKTADGRASQTITIMVSGVNDKPTVSGDETGTVQKQADNSGEVAGALTIVDIDAGQSAVKSGHYLGQYGELILSADGQWRYVLNSQNSAVDQLRTGEHLQDNITYQTDDGTEKSITITINGYHEPTQITGQTEGRTVEDDKDSSVISGKLESNSKTAETAFSTSVEKTSGDLGGEFTIATDGSWTYHRDDANAKLQELAEGESAVETFVVKTADSRASQTITIMVSGVNDKPTVSGDETGTVQKQADNSGEVAGALTVVDIDAGQSAVKSGHYLGQYGELILSADGQWRYVLNSQNNAVDQLRTGEHLQDSITYQTADGTEKSITITINGYHEPTQITGQTEGRTVEDDKDSSVISGKLESNSKTAETAFSTFVGKTTGNLGGSLSIHSDGTWIYQRNDDNPNVQALAEGERAIEQFLVHSTDGEAEQTITIEVIGVNDIPAISGNITGLVEKQADNTGSTTGGLVISDKDRGQSAVKAGNYQGKYGSLTLSDDGQWHYSLDSNNDTVKALKTNKTLQDVITYQTIDGTNANINIEILGHTTQNTLQFLGTVWFDQDNNTRIDGTPVENIRVMLKNSAGNILQERFTDSSGNYQFELLNAKIDEYYVEFDPKTLSENKEYFSGGDSDINPQGRSRAFSNDVELAVFTVNAGIKSSPGSIQGKLFEDVNLSSLNDVGEPTISGVAVKLLKGEQIVAETQTSKQGSYQFKNVNTGDYQLVFGDLPENTEYANGNTFSVSVNAATTLIKDIATYKLATLSGSIWKDDNRDQIIDTTEVKVAGVTVNLLDQTGNIVTTAKTDETGSYHFRVKPGQYKLSFDHTPLETGQYFADKNATTQEDISLVNGVTSLFTLHSSEVRENLDVAVFTDRPRGQVAGRVWLDANGNGIQDENESAVQNVRINILDSEKTKVAEVVTDAEGKYKFETPALGYYYLEVVNEDSSGLVYTDVNVGVDNGIDSDVSPNGGIARFLLAAQQYNTIDIGMKARGTQSSPLVLDIQGHIQNVSSESAVVEGDNVGRYITLRIDPKYVTTQPFNLAEVRVWSGDKLVSTTATISGGGFGSQAISNLNDDNDQNWLETAYARNPWLQFDLGELMAVTRVEIAGRESYQNRLNGITIFLSEESLGGEMPIDLLYDRSGVSEIGHLKGLSWHKGSTLKHNMYVVDPVWQTTDTTPTLKGTITRALQSGERLFISDKEGNELGNVVVDGTNWHSTLTQPLQMGTQDVILKLVKADGTKQNISTIAINIVDSSDGRITLQINDDFGVRQGLNAEGQLQDDASPILSGKVTKALMPGEEIRIYNGEQFIGNAAVIYDAEGNATWHYQVRDLQAGIYQFKAELYNRFSQSVLDSHSEAYYYIDMNNSSLWIGGDTASVFDNVLLANNTLIAYGRLSTEIGRDQRVAVYVNDNFITEATLDSDHSAWQAELAGLNEGAQNVKWRIETKSGEDWLAETDFNHIEIETAVEPPSIQREFNSEELHNGVTFSGQVEPNQPLVLQWGDRVSKEFYADGQGRWSATFYDFDSLFGKQGPIDQQGVGKAILKSGETVLGEISVLLDTVLPEIVSIEADKKQLDPNETTRLTFTFTEDPGDSFDLSDIQVTGGSISSVQSIENGVIQGSGLTRTVLFTAKSDSIPENTIIALNRNSFTDVAGNPNLNEATLRLKIGEQVMPEPTSSSVALRAGSTISLDLRDPTFPLTSAQWQVKVDGLPDSITLSAGTKQSDGSWLVAGTELDSLELITTKADKGDYVLNVTYQQQQSGSWSDMGRSSIKAYIAPWITTSGRTEDPNNFTHYIEAWNDGITGLSGKGLSISAIAEEPGNLAIDQLFDKANIVEGTTLPNDHSLRVMQSIGGKMNGDFTGVAYDSKLSWAGTNARKAEVINMSVAVRAIDNNEWYQDSVKTGRDGLGTVWTVSASNYRTSGVNTALIQSTKSPTLISVASISSGGGTVTYFSSAGEANHIATPGDEGTSFAAPAAAGAMGLILQANPDLGFRDVHNIIAYTAMYYPEKNGDRQYHSFSLNQAETLNGAGLHFSNDVGFGVIDVYGSALLARDWLRGGYKPGIVIDSSNAPLSAYSWWKHITPPENIRPNRLNQKAHIKSTFTFEVEDDITLEAVQAKAVLNDPAFSKLKIVITSPSGTESVIADGTNQATFNWTLTMSSKRFWGENALGIWKVSFEHTEDVTVNTTVRDVQLSFFGAGRVVDDRYVYTDEFVKTFDNLADSATQQKMLLLDDTNEGNDSILASAMRSDVVVNLDNDHNAAYMDLLGKHITISEQSSIENVFTGLGNDVIIGSKQYSSQLVGNAGDDQIVSGKAGSHLEGGEGNDWLMFALGDTASGGTGSDSFVFETDITVQTDLSGLAEIIVDFDKEQDQLYSWQGEELKVAKFDDDNHITWDTVQDQSIITQATQLKEYKYPIQSGVINPLDENESTAVII